MSSFFSNLTHVNYFSYGFSFLEECGEDLNLEDIAEEISTLLDEYSDNRDIPLALDSLYMAMGDVDSAIDALLNDDLLSEFSIFQLKYADHLFLKGDKKEAEKVLNRVILNENRDFGIKKLCALVAFGILGNENEFIRCWNEMKNHKKSHPFSFESFLSNLGSKTILPDLPFKEQIKGIYLLKKFNLKKDLEDETFELIDNLDGYLEKLYQVFISEAINEGVIEFYPGFFITEKICLKVIETAENFLQQEDLIINPDYRTRSFDSINHMKSIQESFKLADVLTKALVIKKGSGDDVLSEILSIADKDSEKIKETLYLFTREDLSEKGLEFVWAHLNMTPNEAEEMFGYDEYDDKGEDDEDLLGYTEVLDPDRERESRIYDRYQTVLNEVEAEEDLTWLISRLNEGRRVLNTEVLLSLSVRLKRVDEIVPFISTFEKYADYNLVYTLLGYQKMQKKDIKGALQMLDKAREYETFPVEIDLYSAILMNMTGYSKRSVGVCEKLLKKNQYNARVVYPILIEGLILLGRDKEAEEARVKYNNIDEVLPNSLINEE